MMQSQMIDLLIRWSEAWKALGATGALLFAGIVVLGALVFLPRPALCLLGGYLYGLMAFPLVLIGSTVGMILALLISRYLFRSLFLAWIASRLRYGAIAKAVDAEGWLLIFLMRIGWPIPATAMNYALGLTRIPVTEFATASILGSAVPVFVFVYIGKLGQSMLDHSVTSLQVALFAASIVIFLFVMWRVTRKAQQLLASHS
jgi:uncharacterized membrane protein YdjX (TVP38/TMEM64 family)